MAKDFIEKVVLCTALLIIHPFYTTGLRIAISS